MNPKRKKLLFTACFIIVGVMTATLLGLKAFQENLLYFYSPSQIKAGEAPLSKAFRVGGLVQKGSVVRNPDSLVVQVGQESDWLNSRGLGKGSVNNAALKKLKTPNDYEEDSDSDDDEDSDADSY